MNGFEPVYITYEVLCKLHHCNFLAWKMEVSRVISSLGLTGYIDGSNPAPPISVLSAEGRTVTNPSFINWFMQDQLLLGWLRSMVYPPVLAMLILSRSSAAFWENLHKYYRENPLLAEVVKLQVLLLNFQRGIQSCSIYCNKMKVIADKLASLGAPVSDAELVTAIASKLGPSFELFYQYIQSIPDGPPSFERFYAMLIAFEGTLQPETQQDSSDLHPEVGSGQGTDNSGHGMSHPITCQGGIGGQHVSQPPQHDPLPAQPPQKDPPPVWPPQQAPAPVWPPRQMPQYSSSSEESVQNYIPDTPDQ